jgi:hypothetical protein
MMSSSRGVAFRAIHVAGTRSVALTFAKVGRGDDATATEMVDGADAGTETPEPANVEGKVGAAARTPPAAKDAATRTKVFAAA